MGSRRQALLPARGPRAGPCADGVGRHQPRTGCKTLRCGLRHGAVGVASGVAARSAADAGTDSRRSSPLWVPPRRGRSPRPPDPADPPASVLDLPGVFHRAGQRERTVDRVLAPYRCSGAKYTAARGFRLARPTHWIGRRPTCSKLEPQCSAPGADPPSNRISPFARDAGGGCPLPAPAAVRPVRPTSRSVHAVALASPPEPPSARGPRSVPIRCRRRRSVRPPALRLIGQWLHPPAPTIVRPRGTGGW